MISNQIIYNCICEINEISKVEFVVTDAIANPIAQTDKAMVPEKKVILAFLESSADIQEISGSLLFKVYENNVPGYVLLAQGTDEAFLVGKIVVSQLQNLIVAYKEKVDKNSFYQNLLLDNLLLVDIYSRAQKLRIDVVKPRCVYVIETKTEKNMEALETVKELVYSQMGDFVTSVDETHIILIKVLKEGYTGDDIEETAYMLKDMLNSEVMMDVKIAYGSVANEIKGLSKAYKEANMALDVGKIFYAEKAIVAYETLGIGRLIYQLPVNLCKMFTNEIFGEEFPEEIDDEIIFTVMKFFENNLNVSETSRQLYIHRNTLAYRMEKIQKATGLDVRLFDDALTLKIALMVYNYIKYMENQNN